MPQPHVRLGRGLCDLYAVRTDDFIGRGFVNNDFTGAARIIAPTVEIDIIPFATLAGAQVNLVCITAGVGNSSVKVYGCIRFAAQNINVEIAGIISDHAALTFGRVGGVICGDFFGPCIQLTVKGLTVFVIGVFQFLQISIGNGVIGGHIGLYIPILGFLELIFTVFIIVRFFEELDGIGVFAVFEQCEGRLIYTINNKSQIHFSFEGGQSKK